MPTALCDRAAGRPLSHRPRAHPALSSRGRLWSGWRGGSPLSQASWAAGHAELTQACSFPGTAPTKSHKQMASNIQDASSPFWKTEIQSRRAGLCQPQGGPFPQGHWSFNWRGVVGGGGGFAGQSLPLPSQASPRYVGLSKPAFSKCSSTQLGFFYETEHLIKRPEDK